MATETEPDKTESGGARLPEIKKGGCAFIQPPFRVGKARLAKMTKQMEKIYEKLQKYVQIDAKIRE